MNLSIFWKQMRTELVWIYEDLVPIHYLTQSVHSSRQSAFLIREGELVIQTEEGKTSARAGQWIFPRYGDRVQRFTPGARVLSLCYHWKWPGDQACFDWPIALVLDSRKEPMLESTALQIKEIADECFHGSGTKLKYDSGHIVDCLKLHRAFLGWLEACAVAFYHQGQGLQHLEEVDSRMLRIAHRLDQHPLNLSFDEKEMARQIGLSPRQMNRLFLAQFSLTPCKYFERRRFEAAMDRVRLSVEPIKQIAYDLGFPTLSRFSTWFLHKAKATPRQIRQRSSR